MVVTPSCPCQLSSCWLWHQFAPTKANPTKVIHFNSQITAPNPHSKDPEDIRDLWSSVYTICDLRSSCASSVPAPILCCVPRLQRQPAIVLLPPTVNRKLNRSPFLAVFLIVFQLLFSLLLNFNQERGDWDRLTFALLFLVLSTFLFTIYVLQEEGIPLPPPVVTIKPT